MRRTGLHEDLHVCGVAGSWCRSSSIERGEVEDELAVWASERWDLTSRRLALGLAPHVRSLSSCTKRNTST